MCLSRLEDGTPNVQKHFIYATIKEEKHCSEERDDFNGRQQAAGSGIWGQGLRRGICVTTDEMESVFVTSKVHFNQKCHQPRKEFVIPGVCHCSCFCSHGSSASHTTLSLQHLFLPSFLCGSQGKMHYEVTISLSCFPYSSAPWHSRYLRCNSGCQHSWDKYIKSTFISFAVLVGCGIVHFLPQIDCSFAFSCQTTVSFYIRGSHISLLGKIIHGDINKACGSNRVKYFGNRSSLISPVNKSPCSTLLSKRTALIKTGETNTSKKEPPSKYYVLALKTKVVYLLGLSFAG